MVYNNKFQILLQKYIHENDVIFQMCFPAFICQEIGIYKTKLNAINITDRYVMMQLMELKKRNRRHLCHRYQVFSL